MVRIVKKDQEKIELLASLNRVNEEFEGTDDNDGFEHCAQISETDEIFLQGLLNNTPKAKVRFASDERNKHLLDDFDGGQLNLKPTQQRARLTVDEVLRKYTYSRRPEARELAKILSQPHLKGLVKAHDEIAEQIHKRNTSQKQQAQEDQTYLFPKEILNGDMKVEAIKMVGLRRNPNQPLGLTVEVDDHGQLVVARILSGGVIDKQGLLHTGDVILEVNGVRVSNPEELQVEVSKAKENLTLKVGPNVDDEMKSARVTRSIKETVEPGKKLTCYMRALFNYDPSEDTLLPCKEIGLPFKQGDILQIISVKDPNWWQAKNLSDDPDKTGLVPSQELEERRKAFVPPEADYVHKIGICGTRISKKKKKTMYRSVANCEFDKADLMLYEEVTRMPPFRRKTLVLIGVSGVGRRTLKNRLINSDPDKFGAVIPHTSRTKRALEENGKSYWFADREDMEEEIKQNNFLEYGEHHGNLYGTHIESIKDVIKNGKMCVLDVAPNSLKILHNSQELMPFVIFIAAPGMEQLKTIYAERRATGSNRNLSFDRQSSIRYSSRRARTLESLASLYEDDDLISTVEESAFIQRKYEKYFDMVIVNEDFDDTFRQVIEALDQMSHEHQWVPVNWIY